MCFLTLGAHDGARPRQGLVKLVLPLQAPVIGLRLGPSVRPGRPSPAAGTIVRHAVMAATELEALGVLLSGRDAAGGKRGCAHANRTVTRPATPRPHRTTRRTRAANLENFVELLRQSFATSNSKTRQHT